MKVLIALSSSFIVFFLLIGLWGCGGDSTSSPENTAPSTPFNFVATAPSATEIHLTWSHTSENEDGFDIWESIGNENNFVMVDTASANISSKDLTGKAPATTYYYKIRAYNGTLFSSYSETKNVTTPSLRPAEPTQFVAEVISSTQINLSWEDVDNETGYRIERRINVGGAWGIISEAPANAASYQDTNCSPDTPYYYRIRSFNESESSAWVQTQSSVRTPDVRPEPPTITNAVGASQTSIRIDWTPGSENHDKFFIERRSSAQVWNEASTFERAGEIRTFSDDGLEPETEYFYRMRAINEIDTSEYSNILSARTLSLGALEVPSGLREVSVTIDAVTLAWDYGINNNEDGFRVEMARTQDGNFVTVVDSGAGIHEATVSGLDRATTYWFRVKAYRGQDSSNPSNTLQATTGDLAPSPPTLDMATPQSPTEILLSWTPTSENHQTFKVFRSETSGGQVDPGSIITTVGNVREFLDSGLTSSTTYYYKIKAVNASDQSSEFSNELSARTQDPPPGAPQSPSDLIAEAIGTSRIDLQWTDNSSGPNQETHFVIERGTDRLNLSMIDQVDADETTYSDETCVNGTTYWYRLYAVNAVDRSGNSNQVDATTKPEMPVNLSTEAVSHTQINLAWEDVSNETGFIIRRRDDVNGLMIIDTTNADARRFEDTGLTLSTTYDYSICAYHVSSGNSEWTESVSETTQSGRPDAPGNLQVSPLDWRQMHLRWNDTSDDEVNFFVERSDDGGNNFIRLDTLAAIDGTGTQMEYTDTGLSARTSYSYKIIAWNEYGGTESETVSRETDWYQVCMFMTTGDSLIVYEVSNDQNWHFVGSFISDDNCLLTCGNIYGDYLYLYDQNNADQKILIIDISNPAHLSLTCSYQIPESGGYPIVDDDVLYYNTNNSLFIIDVADKENPQPLSTIENIQPVIYGLDVRNGYAYVTTLTNGYIYIYDVRNPANPVQRARVYQGRDIIYRSIKVYNDDYAFVIKNAGIGIIDISSPDSPHEINGETHFGHPGCWPHSIRIFNDYLFFTSSNGGHHLTSINISDPGNVNLGDRCESQYEGWTDRMRQIGNRVYLHGRDHQGFSIYDISNPGNFERIRLMQFDHQYIDYPLVDYR